MKRILEFIVAALIIVGLMFVIIFTNSEYTKEMTPLETGNIQKAIETGQY